MTAPLDVEPFSHEPLFAHNVKLWLRVWALMQGAVLVLGVLIAMDAAGGMRAFLAQPSFPRMAALVLAHGLYTAVGVRAYERIMRRTWAIALFVPLGWALVLTASATHGTFSLLIFGAILQGFIFLPFAWAIAVLTSTAIGLTALIALRISWANPTQALAKLIGLPAVAVMIGTVLLYIHRSNRDAMIKSRLLTELQAAQRDLAERARESGVHEERQRLARDVHDTLAQGFTSVIKHLEAVELTMADRDADDARRAAALREHLAHAQSVSRSSLADIRQLVWALRAKELTDAALTPALARVVDRWAEASGIRASFSAHDVPSMEPEAEVTFLRALQESLSNVERHAGATEVRVWLGCADDLVMLTVDDNGRGMKDDGDAGPDHLGLRGMRERVRRFGGQVLVESAEGRGTSLTIAVPLAHAVRTNAGGDA